MWVAFAKATHILFSKNTCELVIVLTRTVNILTTNELVKLTTLLITGHRMPEYNAALGTTFPTFCVSGISDQDAYPNSLIRDNVGDGQPSFVCTEISIVTGFSL